LPGPQSKNSRGGARARGRAPLGSQPQPAEPGQERAFLVGLEVRSRRARGGVTAQAQAARDAASGADAAKVGGAKTASGATGAKSNGSKPSIPEFDADESLSELRTLAESADALVVGEILQRRDRPDPATLIGAGKKYL